MGLQVLHYLIFNNQCLKREDNFHVPPEEKMIRFKIILRKSSTVKGEVFFLCGQLREADVM